MKKPAQYYHVTSEPGRDFVGTLSRDEIRRLLAAGALQASCHATEEDGCSFVQLQQHGGPGRWRTLAELLAEWGRGGGSGGPSSALVRHPLRRPGRRGRLPAAGRLRAGHGARRRGAVRERRR